MNWLKKLRVHLRPYLLLTATAIATVMVLAEAVRDGRLLHVLSVEMGMHRQMFKREGA